MIQHYQIFCKILNRFDVEKKFIWRYLPMNYISQKGLGKTFSKKGLMDSFRRMLGDFTPILLQDIEEGERLEILRCADAALEHSFDLLGSGVVTLDPIRWHSDFKFGYSWPVGVFYKRLRGMTPKGADIKLPWELSRCQHLLWLGEAYLITQEESMHRRL